MEYKKIAITCLGSCLIAAGCSTISPNSVSPEQRAFICQNLRGQIISNNSEFSGPAAASPSPMEGYSFNRSTQLYTDYDKYNCKT